VGKHMHTGVEEFYYVMNGDGTVQVNNESAAIKKGDAIPLLLGDVHTFENTGSGALEFLIIGIAREKGKLDTVDVK
jgi:mannose-6-phosphate isomerase-like protein (cupin superfamily)